MAQASSSMRTSGGIKGSPVPNTNNRVENIYMMKVEANLQTRAHNYGMPESVEKGK
jgi:hypothetical protein